MRGYHNLPEETAAAFTEDGFFRTGDIGELDADGYLTHHRPQEGPGQDVGRQVHRAVATSRACSRRSARTPRRRSSIGQARNFCTMLITPRPGRDQGAGRPAARWTASRYARDRRRAARPRSWSTGYVEELNAKLNRWETIKKFTILPRDLTIEDGEITPSMKIKRRGVETNFAERDRQDVRGLPRRDLSHRRGHIARRPDRTVHDRSRRRRALSRRGRTVRSASRARPGCASGPQHEEDVVVAGSRGVPVALRGVTLGDSPPQNRHRRSSTGAPIITTSRSRPGPRRTVPRAAILRAVRGCRVHGQHDPLVAARLSDSGTRYWPGSPAEATQTSARPVACSLASASALRCAGESCHAALADPGRMTLPSASFTEAMSLPADVQRLHLLGACLSSASTRPARSSTCQTSSGRSCPSCPSGRGRRLPRRWTHVYDSSMSGAPSSSPYTAWPSQSVTDDDGADPDVMVFSSVTAGRPARHCTTDQAVRPSRNCWRPVRRDRHSGGGPAHPRLARRGRDASRNLGTPSRARRRTATSGWLTTVGSRVCLACCVPYGPVALPEWPDPQTLRGVRAPTRPRCLIRQPAARLACAALPARDPSVPASRCSCPAGAAVAGPIRRQAPPASGGRIAVIDALLLITRSRLRAYGRFSRGCRCPAGRSARDVFCRRARCHGRARSSCVPPLAPRTARGWRSGDDGRARARPGGRPGPGRSGPPRSGDGLHQVAAGRVNGSRRKRSSVPSRPNRGPGASRTPTSSAARASALEIGPSSSAQSVTPPRGTVTPPLRQLLAPARRPARPGGRPAGRGGRRRSPSASASRCTATSWSSTGLAMSTPTRSGGQPLHLRRGGAHPADPQAAPVRLAHPADRDHPGVPVEDARPAAASRCRPAAGPRRTRRRPGRCRSAWAAATSRSRSVGGHQVAGRVLELRDQVRQPGPGLPQRAEQQLGVPAGRRRPGRGW